MFIFISVMNNDAMYEISLLPLFVYVGLNRNSQLVVFLVLF